MNINHTTKKKLKLPLVKNDNLWYVDFDVFANLVTYDPYYIGICGFFALKGE
jgi:hypothetical protein